jgi:hypothetical protein
VNSAAIRTHRRLIRRKTRPSGVPLRMILTCNGMPTRAFTVYATKRREAFGCSYHAKDKVLKAKSWSIIGDTLWVMSPVHILRFAKIDIGPKFTVKPGYKLIFNWAPTGILRIFYY